MSDNLFLLAADARQALFDEIKNDAGASVATRFEAGRAIGIIGRLTDALAECRDALDKVTEAYSVYHVIADIDPSKSAALVAANAALSKARGQ